MTFRLNPLCFWLATIVLMATVMLAPSAASAHPGHGEERGQARLVVFQPSANTASLDVHANLANAAFQVGDRQGVYPATFAAQPDIERACAGAMCCGTGHGCCVAYLPAGGEAPSPPTGNPLAIALAGAPPGRGMARLPEPPRLFR